MLSISSFVSSIYRPVKNAGRSGGFPLGRSVFAFVAIGLSVASPLWGQQEPLVDATFYRDQIRPILSNKCYTCHGPDENTREGGFRFDRKGSAFAPADSGATPIVPGKLADSELVKRIAADDESRMPPLDHEKQLNDQEKQRLRQWIAAGAPWQEHWAFTPIRKSDPPSLAGDAYQDWVINEIDRFVIYRLRQQGITPSPEASRETLLRRVSLDLTGLPPTPGKRREFLADSSPEAYERLVDQLLESPHYGEHMAASWLDAARFADTNGYQNDFARKMWPWRDWVIQAFNRNMPFDQFTVEQIAGDMLPNATLQQKIASGFNRNNRSVTEGGSIEAEWHVENVIDRVETTSTVFLGLTMGCGRCHDHKYDPVSQREFYEFYAYFNSSKDKGVYNEKRGNFGPMVSVVNPADQQTLQQLDQKIARVELRLKELEATAQRRQRLWESEFVQRDLELPSDPVGAVLCDEVRPDSLIKVLEAAVSQTSFVQSPFAVASSSEALSDSSSESKSESSSGAIRIEDKENAHLDLGKHFVFDGQQPFSVSAWARPEKFGAILSRMDHSNAYRGFDLLLMKDGRLNVHLIHDWPSNAIKITTRQAIPAKAWSNVTVTYDGSGKAKGLQVFFNQRKVEFEINNNNLNGSTLTDHPLWIGYRGHTERFVGEISEIRLFDRVLSNDEIGRLLAQPVQRTLKIPSADRNSTQQAMLQHIYRTRFSDQEAKLNDQLVQLKKQRNDFRRKLPTTMVMEELDTPRKTYRLIRGQYDQPDKSVELSPGIPEFLPQPGSDLPANRLGLAKWLVDPKNPLTARVTVNRFWLNLFGRGLAETPEDFGVQSPAPSHPELLDWLAMTFIESGWDVKAFHKRVVMSATYRQSSSTTSEQWNQDPINRWLGRGSRFRMSAETIRDHALAVSGLLTRTIGGPSIKPYQPAGVWKELAGGAGEKPYVQDKGKDLYRRSMYIYRKRTVPHPTMATFDAGSREICQVARQRTNTPLQALALLNDPTYVEASRALAVRAMQNSPDWKAQIEFAFLSCTQRPPSAAEQPVLEAAYQRYQQAFRDDPAQAQLYLGVGESTVPEDLDRLRVATLAAVCSTLLNLDETITRE